MDKVGEVSGLYDGDMEEVRYPGEVVTQHGLSSSLSQVSVVPKEVSSVFTVIGEEKASNLPHGTVEGSGEEQSPEVLNVPGEGSGEEQSPEVLNVPGEGSGEEQSPEVLNVPGEGLLSGSLFGAKCKSILVRMEESVESAIVSHRNALRDRKLEELRYEICGCEAREGRLANVKPEARAGEMHEHELKTLQSEIHELRSHMRELIVDPGELGDTLGLFRRKFESELKSMKENFMGGILHREGLPCCGAMSSWEYNEDISVLKDSVRDEICEYKFGLLGLLSSFSARFAKAMVRSPEDLPLDLVNIFEEIHKGIKAILYFISQDWSVSVLHISELIEFASVNIGGLLVKVREYQNRYQVCLEFARFELVELVRVTGAVSTYSDKLVKLNGKCSFLSEWTRLIGYMSDGRISGKRVPLLRKLNDRFHDKGKKSEIIASFGFYEDEEMWCRDYVFFNVLREVLSKDEYINVTYNMIFIYLVCTFGKEAGVLNAVGGNMLLKDHMSFIGEVLNEMPLRERIRAQGSSGAGDPSGDFCEMKWTHDSAYEVSLIEVLKVDEKLRKFREGLTFIRKVWVCILHVDQAVCRHSYSEYSRALSWPKLDDVFAFLESAVKQVFLDAGIEGEDYEKCVKEIAWSNPSFRTGKEIFVIGNSANVPSGLKVFLGQDYLLIPNSVCSRLSKPLSPREGDVSSEVSVQEVQRGVCKDCSGDLMILEETLACRIEKLRSICSADARSLENL